MERVPARRVKLMRKEPPPGTEGGAGDENGHDLERDCFVAGACTARPLAPRNDKAATLNKPPPRTAGAEEQRERWYRVW